MSRRVWVAIFVTLLFPEMVRAQAAGGDVVTDAMRTERRVALLVGNGAYPIGPLRNPVNDARAMAAALRPLGFDVDAQENVTQKELKRAIVNFADRLRNGGVGLFFYAGHGIQVNGKNFMVPIDAQITSESEVEVESVDVAAVLARMETAGNRLNIVVLDACRDNPFARSFRSVSRGLAQLDAPSGTLIAYATAPGKVARDGEGSNGVYTAALLGALRMPGLKIEDVLKSVRRAVQQESRGDQVPWESSSLLGDFVFNVPPRPTSGSLVIRSAQEVVEVWLGDTRIGEVGPLAALLVKDLPGGNHRVAAKARRPGFKPWERELQTIPEHYQDVVIDLQPMPPGDDASQSTDEKGASATTTGAVPSGSEPSPTTPGASQPATTTQTATVYQVPVSALPVPTGSQLVPVPLERLDLQPILEYKPILDFKPIVYPTIIDYKSFPVIQDLKPLPELRSLPTFEPVNPNLYRVPGPGTR